jgi:hypothetical protein
MKLAMGRQVPSVHFIMGSTLQQSPRAQVRGVGYASAVTSSERPQRPVSQSGKHVVKSGM